MQKKDKNSEFLFFYFLNMSKKNLTVLFLLLSGVIAVLAYAGGKQSNWLSDSQINFAKDNLSTDRGNKLEAQLRDAVINGLTTRAQNHEKRLQAFAQSTGYPNLTPEQTSFSDLLSTKHSNQLTADMRNGLLTRLTYAVTNHEMRLRALEKPVNHQTYHCVGTYQDWTDVVSKKVPLEDIRCFIRTKSFPEEEWRYATSSTYCKWVKDGSIIRGYTKPDEFAQAGGSHEHTEKYDRGYMQLIDYLRFRSVNTCRKDNQWTVDLNSCKYECSTENYHKYKDYCDKQPHRESCGNLAENACKAQRGCRWEKDLNLVIRWDSLEI